MTQLICVVSGNSQYVIFSPHYDIIAKFECMTDNIGLVTIKQTFTYIFLSVDKMLFNNQADYINSSKT